MRSIIKKIICVWLALFARLQLHKTKARVIAVAGSSGKTSTGSAIVAALRPFMRVRSGVGFNSETGVPLGILGITMHAYGASDWLRVVFLAPWRVLTDWKKCDVYVAEYGIDHPGDMKTLLAIRVPDIAVLTSVGLEHAGYFTGSLAEVEEKILNEELSFLEAVSEKGIVVAPVRDTTIADRLTALRARVVRIGDDYGDDYALTHYQVTPTATSFELFHKAVSYPVHLSFPITRASAESMELAAATAHLAGVPFKDAITAIAAAWHVPAGRGRVLKGKRGMTIIDSSYNATPFAVGDALKFLKAVAGERRTVAILGDMRELGTHAVAAHQGLYEVVRENADLTLTVGPTMKAQLAPRLKDKGRAFADVTELIHDLDALLLDDDVILIKGSQNTLFLERVVEHLLAEPRDENLLPRRGARWDVARAASR